MYDLLIPSVIERFSTPVQSERSFLEQVQTADLRLCRHFRSKQPISPVIYSDPLIRAAYLLRHLGHYTLQFGDVLNALDGHPEAAAALARPHLKLAALCGGAGPEAIALACLHKQLGGQVLEATVLDLNAAHWEDCWPISSSIAQRYNQHPSVTLQGLALDLLGGPPTPAEQKVLAEAQVFSAMNCLNELVGLGIERVRSGLDHRLALLAPGTLVLASDQALYRDCSKGLTLLRRLLLERGARVLLDDQGEVHEVENRLGVDPRIAWMYGDANKNRFRIWVRSMRLAAVLA